MKKIVLFTMILTLAFTSCQQTNEKGQKKEPVDYEITWFCLQEETYRKEWPKYAYDWVREHDPNGFLQMPVCRIMVTGDGQPVKRCHANTRTADFPQGMNLEETIKNIWLQ